MQAAAENLEESLKILDVKLNQLKVAYDQYFLGSRPREPRMERGEIEKLVLAHLNSPIQNAGLRFRFSGICSRFQAFKRQWNDTLRKMEEGTYVRHRFKAELRARVRGPGEPASQPSPQRTDDLFDAFVNAKRSCGQDTKGITPATLEKVVDKQRVALRERYGDVEFEFKVVVQEGRVKLRASRAN